MDDRVAYWQSRLALTEETYANTTRYSPERKRIELSIRYFKKMVFKRLLIVVVVLV